MLLSACTKNYTIDLNDIERRMVINGIFCSDSTFKIRLFEEAPLSDFIYSSSEFKIIENAEVLLSSDNHTLDTMNFFNGEYYGHIKPEASKNYQIQVNAIGYDAIESTNTLPAFIDIDSLVVSKTNDLYYNFQLKVFFKDPPDKSNFYFIGIPVNFNLNSGFINGYRINDASVGDWHSRMYQMPIFNDDLFNGQQHEIIMEIAYNPPTSDNTGVYSYYKKVNLYSLSKDLYLYIQSYNNQVPKYGDNLLDYFQEGLIEPIPIYSNVKGGLGIFAGYTISQDSAHFSQ
jgi:hypothetical protein